MHFWCIPEQKGKKKKEVTVSWQEFMKDSVSSNSKVVSSWADEMESQNPEGRLNWVP